MTALCIQGKRGDHICRLEELISYVKSVRYIYLLFLLDMRKGAF
jgi:hypothetical protein